MRQFPSPFRWLALALCAHSPLLAGPYSAGLNDPAAADAPVPGFVGPDGEGRARLDDGFGGFINPRNYVNPLFFRWALEATDYWRADGQSSFSDETLALGPVTGDEFDVLSLGDLTATQIAGGAPVGEVTLNFTDAAHLAPIRNLPGADFVVFENGFTAGAGAFTELAQVEVSSDGVTFARFPGRSLTPSPIGPYGIVDPTNVFNFAGKHVNHADEECWGTPFDLSDLATHPLVLAGTVDLDAVRHVRVVDVPGDGSFLDSMGSPIYDQWHTFGSGGFDLEAIGAISVAMNFEEWQNLMGLVGGQRGALADPDADGAVNLVEYSAATLPLAPDAAQLPRAELAGGTVEISFRRDVRPADLIVEVLGTSALDQPWQVIARSSGGGDLLPVAPFAPVMADASDSPVASLGVIRRQRVRAVAGQRFLRIGVSLAP
jgi:hypothetical protein